MLQILHRNTNEPTHEIMAFFVLRKLQTGMRNHPVWLDVLVLVGPFVYFHTSCEQTAKALARLRGCAGSPEPLLVAYVMSTIISWAGSNNDQKQCKNKMYIRDSFFCHASKYECNGCM